MSNVAMVPKKASTCAYLKAGRLDHIAQRLFFSLLGRLRQGRITIIDHGRTHVFGRQDTGQDLEATVQVHHPRFYGNVVLGGSIGAGEAYMAGYWSVDDLPALFRIVLLNRCVFQGMDQGLARLKGSAHKLYHLLRRDTLTGSRRNIADHYDLGNEFYAQFLDETMTYSCGIFEQEESTLKEASIAKYRRIADKLDLRSLDHVIEIGTGWGGFALYAAREYGCRVTTTTISRAQYEFARKRFQETGLEDGVELLFKDYRDVDGKYDKLVSIEMIEAVGHHYFDTFFRACSNLLKQDGMMMMQAITISDQVFDRHKRSVDFIKRYIFPGSCIPSVTAMCRSIARVSDLRLDHLEDITPHYARTLRMWRERFFENLDGVKALGFPNSFIRMWEYYLSYCEAGFQERYLGDVQMRLIKPLARPTPLLPQLDVESET
jgi:cyclopropane-fatty-acyl-phospholipid synthase